VGIGFFEERGTRHVVMTREEAIAKIKAEKAAYVREWRKKNPEKVKEYEKKRMERKIERYMQGVK
jgi:hypothetical protein